MTTNRTCAHPGGGCASRWATSLVAAAVLAAVAGCSDAAVEPPATDSGAPASDPGPASGTTTPPGADASTDPGTPSGGVDASLPPVTGGGGRWVMGYYAAYDRDALPPASIDFTGLTHVVTTRLKVLAGGKLATDFDVGATEGPALAKEIAQRAHAAGKKAILMLGGAEAGTPIRAAAADATRATFVANLIAATKTYGYDGLDLDWENDVDMGLFVSLVQDLRKAAPTLILTVPTGPVNPNIDTLDPRWATIAASVDQVNLMTYYPATAVAGGGWLSWHNAPLRGWKASTPVTIEDSLARFVKIGVPKAKLGMGMAFYAICYTGSVTAPNQNTDASQIQGGDNDYPLSSLYGTGGVYSDAYKKWDDTAQATYLTLPKADARGCRYVSFEDERSIAAKGAFARQNGYGGTIVWTINQGYVPSLGAAKANFLMQALKKGFID